MQANDRATVLGTTGTGKSSLARQLNDLWPRSIIIDPIYDWKKGDIFNNFDIFSEKLIKLKENNAKEFRLIFQFDPDAENMETIFNEILRLAFHYKNLQIVIDEIQLFSSPHYTPKYLKNLLMMGRHQNVSLIGITQRPGSLNKAVLAQSQHVFCGQLIEKNDLRVVSDLINVDQEEIINLPRGQFFHFSPGEKIKKIKLF